jgi:WD40 repeat protein
VASADAVTVWDVAARKSTHTLGGKNWVTVSPDGRWLATGNGEAVRVWDCQSWASAWELTGHTQAVLGGAFSPDGSRLVTCAADRTVRTWDLSTGRPATDPWRRDGLVLAVGYTRDGRVVEAYSGVLAVVDPATGAAERHIEHAIVGRPALAVAGDDTLLVLSTPSAEVLLLPLADPRAVRHLRGHTAAAFAVAVSRDGRRLVSAGQDFAARVWDLTPNTADRELARLPAAVGGLAVSPDGRWAAVAAEAAGANPEANPVQVFDTQSGMVTASLPGHKAAAFAPDCSHLYTIRRDGGVTVYRLADGTPVRAWLLPNEFACRLALSPDGTRLAVGTLNGTVVLLATDSDAIPPPVLGGLGTIEALAFHPKEDRLAVSGRARSLVWDLSRSAAAFEWPQAKGARAVAYDPAGRWLAAVDTDRTVRRYDATSGDGIGLAAGSVARILGMAVHPDGQRLVTCSADGAVKVWDVTTGRDVLTFPGTDYPFGAVAWDPDGERLFTADRSLRVRTGGSTGR